MRPSLDVFYVVTETSTFEVRSKGTCNARVVELARDGALVSPGRKVVEGGLAAICDNLRVFSDRRWSLWTDPIVALFAEERAAVACFQAAQKQKLDLRWRRETADVLATIGHQHPSFYASEVPGLELRPAA